MKPRIKKRNGKSDASYNLTIRLDPELKHQLDRLADIQRRSRASILHLALNAWLAKEMAR
jgi:predicted transcriptional regulator